MIVAIKFKDDRVEINLNLRWYDSSVIFFEVVYKK
jgi:hypothetical protein